MGWHVLLPGDDPLVDWWRLYGDAAEAQGWSLFECSGDGRPPIELERVDEMGIFDDDQQAWRFVVRNAQAGDLACATALHVLARESPTEHAAIIAHHRYDNPGGSSMLIVTNSVDTDERLARLFVGWVVGILLETGDMLDITVTSVERNEHGFVTLDGPEFDEQNPDIPGPHRSIALVDIEGLEVY